MNAGKSMAMGVNVTHLPLTDSRCNSEDCLAFQAAEDASQAQVSWASQFLYGEWMAWYVLVWIALFALAYAVRLVSARRRAKRASSRPRASRPSFVDKTVAVVRFWSYRRLPGKAGLTFDIPSLGVIVIMLLAWGYVTALSFWRHPFYREKRGFGSPPLAVRTGLMSTALIPFIVALSGKANLITLVTGISYERLNVFHRWMGWLCFYLACIHTIPFFTCVSWEGGAKYLHDKFYAPGALEYTGVPPFVILVFLIVSSISFLRNRLYEIWASLHWLGAVLFLAFMFWHCDNEGNSWTYLWVTLGLWLAQIAGRAFGKTTLTPLRDEWLRSATTHLQFFPGGTVKLFLRAPNSFRWSPGQHVFLRFSGFSTFHNHPFTIASAAPTGGSEGKESPENTMTFLIRGYQGFTGSLLRHAESNPLQPLQAWIDGPYGHHGDIELSFDNAVLVAGGVGITACLPWLAHLAARVKESPEKTTCRRIHLLWIVHRQDALSWFQKEILEAIQTAPEGAISVEIWLTQGRSLNQEKISSRITSPSEDEEKGRAEIDLETASSSLSDEETLMAQRLPLRLGRPQLQKVVPSLVKEWGGRTWILGSGPKSLKIDISNAAASLQREVLKSKDNTKRIVEVALHTETYGW